MPRTTRLAAGAYEVTDIASGRVVSVYRQAALDARYGQWLAVAQWDGSIYTDPMMTKCEAVAEAVLMLAEA